MSNDIVESKIPRETRRIMWNIADFADIKDTNEFVEKLSITFEMWRQIGPPPPVKLKVYLRLQQDEGDEDAQSWIGLYCELAEQDPYDDTKVMGKLGIRIQNYFSDKHRTPKNLCEATGWRRVISQNEDVTKLPLDASGALPIEITVTLYNIEQTNVTINDLLDHFQERFAGQLSEDMEMLYKKPFLMPGAPITVTVVSRDGKEFPANLSTLAARSGIFCPEFEASKCSKMVKDKIVLEDIGGEALEVLLHFIHTATLKDNWKEPNVLEELLVAAQKHMMPDLQDFLNEAVGFVCSPENVASMIRVVLRLGLKKSTERLLKMYKDQWMQLTDVDQLMELFQK